MCILMLSLNYDIWILVKIVCHSSVHFFEQKSVIKQNRVVTRSMWSSRKWFKSLNLPMRNQMYFSPSIALTRMTNWWSCFVLFFYYLAADTDGRDGLRMSHQRHTDLSHLFCIMRTCKPPDKMFALPRTHPVWYLYQFTPTPLLPRQCFISSFFCLLPFFYLLPFCLLPFSILKKKNFIKVAWRFQHKQNTNKKWWSSLYYNR